MVEFSTLFNLKSSFEINAIKKLFEVVDLPIEKKEKEETGETRVVLDFCFHMLECQLHCENIIM